MSCSLALVAGAMAQQDDNSPAPKKKPHGQGQASQEAAAPARTQEQRPAVRQNRGMTPDAQRGERHNARPDSNPNQDRARAGSARQDQQQADTRENRGMKGQQAPTERGNARSDTNANQEANRPQTEASRTGSAHPNGDRNANAQAEHQRRGQPNRAETSTTTDAASAREKASAQSNQAQMQSRTNQSTSQASSVKTAQGNKPDIQTIKAQHANFRAQPKPDKVPAVTFNQNRTITGSENWQGQQYTVFRSYRPVYHDQSWYRSHYTRVELIGGGYYYFNGGYWYPAWGYEPSAQYYAYDGPIYAGHEARPPDQVIADVQAALQEMGYYRGEVDGLLGPLTREALTGYQNDHGLYTTAAIDQPTLDSLGI